MKVWLGGLWGLLAFSIANVAAAAPHHDGFTGDLGIGASVMMVPRYTMTASCADFCTTSTSKSTEWEWGLAPLSLSLGGWVHRKVAILGRASGTSYFDDGDQISHNFYGPIVEVWPDDRFYLSGGIGLAVFGANPFFSRTRRDPETGWALDFRVGTALAQGKNHDFTLSVEAIPGFYDGEKVVGFGLVGAWKWY